NGCRGGGFWLGLGRHRCRGDGHGRANVDRRRWRGTLFPQDQQIESSSHYGDADDDRQYQPEGQIGPGAGGAWRGWFGGTEERFGDFARRLRGAYRGGLGVGSTG